MKSKLTLLSMFLLVAGFTLFAQEISSKLNFLLPLETFDEGNRTREWKVRGSRFSSKDYPQVRYADAYPKARKNIIEDESTQRVLGVKFKFQRKGSNFFEIYPVDKNTLEYSPIYFDGVVETIDLWVWGANYRYDLEACLMDYHGIIHRIKVCSLEFIGWQHKIVKIPMTIPQLVRQLPHARELRLTKFIVTTNSKERVDEFYLYLDHIKYLTNKYYDTFDGDELVEKSKIEEIWGNTTPATQ